MKKIVLCLSLMISMISALASDLVGKPAPGFSLMAEDGKVYDLKNFKGKTVVLEWLNHGCPFVRKHYDSNNMQKLQKEAMSKNVVWLSIISSAPGKQGHSTPAQALKDKNTNQSKATHILIDEDGKVGKKKKTKTTPHMFVISAEGNVIYDGAIDSIASTDKEDVAKADSYFLNALNNHLSGHKIKMSANKPYGCSVKYN